jgi:hypothetical protein
VSEPEHVALAREATEAGLTVTHLMPATIGRGFNIQLWAGPTLWVEGPNVSAAMIRAHINHYPAHRQAVPERSGLRLVSPTPGQALTCGCLATTNTTEEAP